MPGWENVPFKKKKTALLHMVTLNLLEEHDGLERRSQRLKLSVGLSEGRDRLIVTLGSLCVCVF